MASSGALKAIALVGLMLGCGGIGIGAYSVYSMTIIREELADLDERTDDLEDIISDENAWYICDTSVYVAISQSWTTIEDLTISFNVDNNEVAYFSYVAKVTLHNTEDSYISVRFNIDGTGFGPDATTKIYGGKTDWEHRMISLQHFTDDLSTGYDAVTVEVVGFPNINFINWHSLFVQTISSE